jgi:hypothetical protein
MPASSRSRPGGSRKRPADDITPDDGGGGAGPAAAPTPPPPNGPVLSFLGPASALLGALQQDDPLASMSQADKDARTLAAMFCGRLATRIDLLGLSTGNGKLGPFHRPRVQPSTAAQLWGPSAAAAASGDGGAAAAVQEEEERLLQPLKRSRVLESNEVQEPPPPMPADRLACGAAAQHLPLPDHVQPGGGCQLELVVEDVHGLREG